MDRKNLDRIDSSEGFSTLDREMYENPLVFAEAPMDLSESFESEGLDDPAAVAAATEAAYDKLATGWCG